MSQNKILSKIIFRLSIPFRKLLLRRKNVFLKKNVKLDSRTSFEGNSYIYKNCRIINSKIGFGTYVANDSILINSIVGKYCSIASNVKTIIGNHPLSPFVSTHPAFFSTKRQAGFTYTRTNKFSDFKYLDEDKRISFIIGNDVWIGSDVKLLEGIRVGDGSVIATGSLVTRDIPPYEIWGGVPAKKIKDRFNSEIKEILLKFRWWEKPQIWIIESQDKFENIYSFIQHINIEIQSEMMRKIK